jgi:hypothetical protein
MTQKIGENTILNADVYYNYLTGLFKRDLLYASGIPNPSTGTGSFPGFGTINALSQRTYGFDLQASTIFSRQFKGSLAYSFVDGAIETGVGAIAVPNVANNKIWSSVTYTLGNLSFVPKAKWLSQINTANGFFNSNFSQGSIPGYFLLDFTARANKIFGTFDAILNVSNLLDTYYETWTYPWGSGQTYPGLGRIISVGLEAKF